MMKLNLQLFAKKSNSEIAKEVIAGKWGNGAERKSKLASAGYDYSAVQSIVNSTLKGSSNTAKNNAAPSNTNKNTNNQPAKTNTPVIQGVDQTYVDKAYQEYKPSEKEKEYLANRDAFGQSMVDKMNTGPQFSKAVTQAFDYLQSQQDYFKNGKTSWDDKIFGQIDKIENRDKFAYDVDNDPLFQQALASAMSSGKSAMQDTIGQASSLTGGYGSTFATTAGNQAYNAFIEDAYNNLPEYYQMALQAYQAEGEEMYNLLGMYTQMGESEWNRNVDAYNTVFNYANSQRDFEYGMHQDDIANAFNTMNMYDSFYQQENAQNLAMWQQSIENAWKTIEQQSSDYWNTKNYDESVRQFDQTFKANYTSDGKGGYVAKGNTSSESTGYAASEKQKAAAKEAYEKNGLLGLEEYVATQKDGMDTDTLLEYVQEDSLPKGTKITKTKETRNGILGMGNWFGHVDSNDEFTVTYPDGTVKKNVKTKDLPKGVQKQVYGLSLNKSRTW